MLIFVVDPHGVYRRGVAACLAELDDVTEVFQTSTHGAALAHPSLADANVTLVDPWQLGGAPTVRTLVDATAGSVIACSARCDSKDVLDCIQAGASGYLIKDTLTAEGLTSSAYAASRGSGVLAPELLSDFMHGLARVSRDLLEPRGLSLSVLSPREADVLSCVAEGQSTRETAQRLHYSERTVKNVLHDAVTKLNARSRAQAVAEAVRQGLI